MKPGISHTVASVSLARLAHRFWNIRCHEEPLFAIHAGVKPPSSIVFREGHQDYERRYTAARGLLHELVAIPENQLYGQDWATYRLLRKDLEDICDFYDVKAHQRPSIYPFGPEYAAIEFVNSVTISTAESAELYLERLHSIPAYFLDVIDNLSRGYSAGFRYPRQVVVGAVATVRSYVDGSVEHSSWLGPFLRTPRSDPAIDRIAARTREFVTTNVLPALQAYADFLESLSVTARDSISCRDAHQGDELYRILLAHFTTTDLSAREVHEIGLSEVARLTQEMLPVAADAGFGADLRAYRAYLSTEPSFIAPSKEALREEFERLSERIDRKVPELFGKIPKTTYVIRSIPEALAALLPGAYAQPNAADGSTPGVHWVTSLPYRAPSFTHIPLALHEGWPGHLMHMVLIEQAEGNLPLFRRYAAAFAGAWRYSACLEGWALYCEGLGVDMGLYETPHQHFGRLDMEMMRALRLAADTGMHAMGWSRSQAIEFMSANQAQHPDTIAAEVDRFIGMPGQGLSYQIGNLKFRELRRRAEQRLGRRFDMRAFHDQIMTVGAVTLPVLDRLMTEYLDHADTPRTVQH